VKVKIDNVKAKIDNVKAKIQDNEKKEPWSRPTLARCVFGQLAASPTSSPLEGPHDNSPPRTTSPFPTGAWAQTHNTNTTTDEYGGANVHVMQIQQLAAMQAARPTRALMPV
jgi:hypothetical protein